MMPNRLRMAGMEQDRQSRTLALMDDAALMARVARGDADAYAALVDRHLAQQVAYAGRLFHHPAEAEDAVQAAFLKVWQKAASFDPARAAFSTWLYRVVTNQCLDQKRKRRHSPLEAAGDPADPGAGPDQGLQEEMVARRLAAALERLPERQRIAISLCYFDGLSNKEAADILDVGIKGLESLLSRARGTLKTLLADDKAMLLED